MAPTDGPSIANLWGAIAINSILLLPDDLWQTLRKCSNDVPGPHWIRRGRNVVAS